MTAISDDEDRLCLPLARSKGLETEGVVRAAVGLAVVEGGAVKKTPEPPPPATVRPPCRTRTVAVSFKAIEVGNGSSHLRLYGAGELRTF